MCMAMGHERSKPLHNFNLPCNLKWGHQKFLRCAKVDHSIQRRRDLHVDNHRRRSTDGGGGGDGGIAAVREKLMFDLQTEADMIKNTIFREVSPSPAPMTAAPESSTPWNLRTRRAACKAPPPPPPPPPMNGIAKNSSPENKSLRLRSEFAGAGAGDTVTGEKREREREKFSISLGRKEIEEDFMAMVGHRPPRRPKKRVKFVQKNLDTLFPGLWLSEITPDLYKVPDDQ